MDMPRPTEHHEKLRALAGEWEGEESLHPSPWTPEKRAAIGRFHNRIELDGMFLVNDYEEERDGAICFRGHGVYGWDAERERYTMHWFDSIGLPPTETLGVWTGDTLVFTNRGASGHARYTYRLLDADRFTFSIETSGDGEAWSRVMDGDYRRR
jgi:hypothetical protein